MASGTANVNGDRKVIAHGRLEDRPVAAASERLVGTRQQQDLGKVRIATAGIDCLYVHDVAVLPEVRGHRSAERYAELMEECARKIGVGFLVLVSVYSTQRLWAQCGFEVANGSEFDMKLRSYGPTAKYMIRNLRSP
jgi:N-acetylglutamate synthase-like GNAT family acetyltransferase